MRGFRLVVGCPLVVVSHHELALNNHWVYHLPPNFAISIYLDSILLYLIALFLPYVFLLNFTRQFKMVVLHSFLIMLLLVKLFEGFVEIFFFYFTIKFYIGNISLLYDIYHKLIFFSPPPHFNPRGYIFSIPTNGGVWQRTFTNKSKGLGIFFQQREGEAGWIVYRKWKYPFILYNHLWHFGHENLSDRLNFHVLGVTLCNKIYQEILHNRKYISVISHLIQYIYL